MGQLIPHLFRFRRFSPLLKAPTVLVRSEVVTGDEE